MQSVFQLSSISRLDQIQMNCTPARRTFLFTEYRKYSYFNSSRHSIFSVWFCTCSLAVSIGAVILLPFSVLGSEILHSYPDNYYLKWLNWSFINSLWNHVFLLSNISLFFLLPFSYFFLESQVCLMF